MRALLRLSSTGGAASRRPFVLVAGLLLVLWSLFMAADQPAGAQGNAGSYAVRYTGTLTLGGRSRPAAAGTTIRVVAARSITDATVCGTGAVLNQQGHYSVEVPANPGSGCVPAARPPACSPSSGCRGCASVLYLFVVNQENLNELCSTLSLDQPSTLGKTVSQFNLQGTNIPGVPHEGSPVGPNGELTLPFVRFYGTVALRYYRNRPTDPPLPRICCDVRPPPVGATIIAFRSISLSGTAGAMASLADTRFQQQAGPVQPICGTGSVTDEQGNYFVDIKPIPACADKIPGALAGLHYGFLVQDTTIENENDPDSDGLGGVCIVRPYGLAPAGLGAIGKAFPHSLSAIVDATSDGSTPLRATLYTPQVVASGPPPSPGPPAPAPAPSPSPTPAMYCEPDQPVSSGVTTAPADLVRMGFDQGVDCPTGVPVRVRVVGDAAFQAQVAGCLGKLRAAAKGSRHLRDLLDSLDNQPTSENALKTTIEKGMTLTGAVTGGFQTTPDPDNSVNQLEAMAGFPKSARITFDSYLASALGATTPGPGIFGVFFDTPFDPCATIVHELTHASNFMYGLFDSTLRPAVGGSLPAEELAALAQENRYRFSQGLPAVQTYIYRGRVIELPEEVKFPDP